MTIRKDSDGRRSIEVQVEVPGSPEEVWSAIATGPGISSWFLPTEVEEREGGKVAFHFGPGESSAGNVTVWEPGHRFGYEEPDWNPPAPALATEHIVEARDGGTCVVRIVSSLFTSSAEWDDYLESMEAGWAPCFKILRLYLTHFGGQRGVPVHVLRVTQQPSSEIWPPLTSALGLADASVGQRWSAPADSAPRAVGVINEISANNGVNQINLLLDEPAPGIASVLTHGVEIGTHISVALYLFGDEAAAAAERDEPRWRTWMNEQFPAPDDAKVLGS